MSQSSTGNFRVETQDGVTVVTPTCPQIVAEVRDDLYAVADGLSGPGPHRVVLSLKPIRQIQSAAIGILINFQKRVRDAGGALKIADLDPNILEVFKLTKMDQVLDLSRSTAEAVDAFHGRGKASGAGGGGWFGRLFGGK
jgi:anti-sigma B factor antagonist